MAKTNLPSIENNIDNTVNADTAAWLAECAAIKCHIHDNSVWAYSGGRLFRVAPIPGFAALPVNSRRLVASMAMQYLPTRVGQTGTGDLSAEIEKAITAPDKYFSLRDKNAFEAAFEDRIADLVDTAKGWDVENLSKEQKAERAEIIKASADRPANREKHFQAAVDDAIAAGANVTRVRKRQSKKAVSDKAFDL